jgi:hydrogenase maturation protease
LVSSPNGPASSGASEAPPALLIVGCGNPTRSDDGAGIEVVRLLRQRAGGIPPGVRLIDAGTSGMEVMFAARAAIHVVIVDACRSASESGAIFRLPARDALTPAEHGFSLHGLRWDHALYAGSKMFGEAFIDRAEVFLVEAQSLDYGLTLSPAVEQAVQRVVVLLGEMIDGAG